MKIFSSFDTNFKNEIYQKKVEEYGKDNVMIISHGKFFYYFMVIFPALMLLLGIVLYFLAAYWVYTKVDGGNIYWIIILILSFIFLFPLSFGILKRYIDYILDFVIVTPNDLTFYNQEGILSRKGRTVDSEKIKTITVNKTGLLRSIFNFGNLVILTEGDEQGAGEINFHFVDDPDNVKFKVLEIIEKGKKQD